VCATTTANEEAVTKEELLLGTTVFGGKYREIKVQGSSCRDMQGAADSGFVWICMFPWSSLILRACLADVLCDGIASRD
jgi:hypothetical protein